MALKKSDLYSSLWASCDELRGGMDASQYKDYVLFMRFIKYVSDKYADFDGFDPPITIPKGASFKDMVALKGDSDIGNKINTQVIQPLIDANSRLARSDFPDFNDPNKLGEGAAKVERLSNLVAIFEKPELDFSKNRAEHDDILGDAYEYLMRHFASESGKSKGQFYTPAEVSRIMAKVIGISPANSKAATTAYDPTCGSAHRNYQLSNRFAWAWKLASLGVPVVLVYLGFLDADEMPAPLKSADDWQRCVLDHAEGIVPQGAWEQPIPVGSASIIPLIRSARVSASVERAVPEESHQTEPHDGPVAILCADWGKEPRKRAVYLADVATRSVRRMSSRGWTVSEVLAEAQRCESQGSVLVTFDAPLGVPASYLAALADIPASGAPKDFLEFTELACAIPEFFDATSVAGQWAVERPFFNVPPGQDGLGAYLREAGGRGVDLYRVIDRQTRAKSVFVKAGIPGSVGSAACALWSELGALMTTDRQFRVWPFEGDLESLLKTVPVVIGEIYPRAAYSTALLDDPGTGRPPLVLAKTDGAVRRSAVDALQKASWVQRFGVALGDLADAENNEDDFDACITAAALLRCVLEGLPLSAALNDASLAEGGILGTGSVDLQLRERAWSGSPPKPASTRAAPHGDVAIGKDPAPLSKVDLYHVVASNTPKRRIYQCPIPGCEKTFVDSRGGWDAHVGSIRQHPGWHSALLSPKDRRRQFELEFPSFFV